MAEEHHKKGRDSDRVSTQDHEIFYLMNAAKVSREKVLEAIRVAGPDREKVLAYLTKK